MTVRCHDGAIVLVGDCPVEDAEALLGLLLETPELPVDLSACGRIHTAVAQVLLAARPRLAGMPQDRFLATWVLAPVLDVPPENTSSTNDVTGHFSESRTRSFDLE